MDCHQVQGLFPYDSEIKIGICFNAKGEYTIRYEDKTLKSFMADHLSISGYYRNNERQLENNIFIPFNIPHLPQAGTDIHSENFTDVETFGFRFELNRALGKHMITYGTDFFQG